MLKQLRKHSKTVIWVVVLAFCLWGGYAFSIQFQKQGRIAGEIFGKQIAYQDFNLFYKANQIFAYGGKKPPEDPNLLQIQTWQSLIYNFEARNKKIQVSDDEIREEVMRLLKDQKIENPSPQLYERWLAGNFRMTPTEFENQIREVLRIQKLIQQFNGNPVPAPSAEEIRDRFMREHNSLSLDVVSFKKKEAADSFHQSVVKDPVQLNDLAKKQNVIVQNTGKIALDAIINLWQIPQETATGLLKAAPGKIEGPIQRAGEYSILRLKEKDVADDSKFTAEIKKRIKEQLENQKKYDRFLAWNAEIEGRANLKDYTPQAESLAKTKEVKVARPQETKTPEKIPAKAATNAPQQKKA